MVTPRRFETYPVEYTALFLRAIEEPVRVNFTTPKEAERFRSYLYAFRRSILDTVSASDKLVIIAPLISFKIDDTAVIVYKPNRTAAMQRALNVREGS